MKTLLDLKAELIFAESAIRTLTLDENVPFLMYQRIAKQFKLTGLVPIEPEAPSREVATLPTLLKRHGSPMTAQSFYRKARSKGLILIKHWPHPTKNGKFKNKIVVTDEGSSYAENHMAYAQPLWYVDSFREVLNSL
jgi:hypothetical protein